MNLLINELRHGGRALLRDNVLTDQIVRQLRRHEAMSAEQLAELALHHLHRSLRSAIARLPHYAHIRPDFPVAAAERVLREQFPIIDRHSLLTLGPQLYPNGGVKALWQARGQTSGTTGTPLTVLRSIGSVLMEQAFLKRHWAWAGFHDGMTRATLRGELVVPLGRATPPFWFWNRYNRQLLLSSRHLTESCADALIERLEQAAPAMLQAYPSTAYALAGLLARRSHLLRIPYVFTASEPLYAHQRALIVERLGCTVMDMYGMAERVALATQCEHGALHLNPDYAHVDIVDDDGVPTDGEGFVVGTTFHNHAMPLVRYRLSDRTRWRHGTCRCGRAFPMIEPVSGKYEDRITGSAGQVVSPSVLTFAFKGLQHIERSQLAQVGPGRWQVRLQPGPGFTAADGRRLVDNIHALVDPGVAVEVVLVAALASTAAGKFRWVVNETAPQP